MPTSLTYGISKLPKPKTRLPSSQTSVETSSVKIALDRVSGQCTKEVQNNTLPQS